MNGRLSGVRRVLAFWLAGHHFTIPPKGFWWFDLIGWWFPQLSGFFEWTIEVYRYPECQLRDDECSETELKRRRAG